MTAKISGDELHSLAFNASRMFEYSSTAKFYATSKRDIKPAVAYNAARKAAHWAFMVLPILESNGIEVAS